MPKLQGILGKKTSTALRERLLRELGVDDRVAFRAAGGPGAGSFLLPPGPDTPSMPDAHFVVEVQGRLRLSVCPEGATCKHICHTTGRPCGALLDRWGKHARSCGVGGSRDARHDGLRDYIAKNHSNVTGIVANTEQRVPAWDRVTAAGELEEARLDVATRDAITGRTVYVDVTVTCEHSKTAAKQQARARNDGVAAQSAVQKKRSRYPPAGGELIPMAFEANGRPSDETIEFVRSYGHGLEKSERSAVVSRMWQDLNTILHVGNAEMILSAVGR